MKRSRVARAIAAMSLLTASLGAADAVGAQGAAVGEWYGPFSEGGDFDDRPPITKEEAARFPAATSITVLPDGRVLYWNGVEGYETAEPHTGMDAPDQRTRSRILDLRGYLKDEADRPAWSTPSQETGIGGDLFCSDLRNLPDGRLLVVGGTEYDKAFGDVPVTDDFVDLWGSESARTFDPGTSRWSEVQPMHYKRWYPSLVSLPDGDMFVAGGVERAVFNDKLRYVNETETFDPSTGAWTKNGPEGATALPYYARLHLLPSGKVFYDASGQLWGPFGPAGDMAEWNKQKLYDPVTRSWTEAGLAPLGARSGTFSSMLPLKPPYDEAQIVVAGGTLSPTSPGTYLGTNLTEIITAKGDTIERVMGPSLTTPRWHSSGVVLPSGELLAFNGGDRDETVNGGTTFPVRRTEMFDGERWVPLAPSKRARVYHHTTVLLGDGSVLVGGHAPLGLGPFAWPPDDYTKGIFAGTLRDPSFEIYKPPYLFRGKRPKIAQTQAGVEHGATFDIRTPDADRVTSVVLSRLPSVTHLSDSDQRTVELTFERTPGGVLRAAIPADPAVTLSGHYYLFLMSDNGQGPTPSRAAIVQIGREDLTAAPMPFGR